MILNSAMIVDDSAADQFLTRNVIELFDSNIEITQAHDGKEALALLNTMETPPDIIFLDINMPRMNGLEFLEAYAKQKDQTSVVTMLTSSDQEHDKKTSMSYDFVTNYLMKLLDEDDMNVLKEQDITVK